MKYNYNIKKTITIPIEDINEIRVNIEKYKHKTFIVDITSLTKPAIFVAIRSLLVMSAQFVIVQTNAVTYFPLEDDIKGLLKPIKYQDVHKQFPQIISKLYVGESGPYEYMNLLEIQRELSSRPNALIGIITSKNQRLLSLLDSTEYECAGLICQKGKTYSAKLAGIAAEIAMSSSENITIVKEDLNRINDFSKRLVNLYHDFYVSGGMDVDLAITGTKMNAVVCAVFTKYYRINQCWYVKPQSYDSDHFSKGIAETKYYIITKNSTR